jgi:Tfp pilus assembly protein PilO
MSAPAPLSLARAKPASGAAPPVETARRRGLTMLAQELGPRLMNHWLPRLSWSLGRTGRLGLTGFALLGASAVFYFSSNLQMTDEVRHLRADLQAAQARAAAAPPPGPTVSQQSPRTLPARADMPQVLNVLLKQVDQAQLTIDTAKYEITASRTGALVRYQMSFPVDGPYPRIRQFIDATLNAMPALAIENLAITRKAVGDESVEAQIRMTIFTRSEP